MARPDSVGALVDVVRSAAATGGPLRPVGSGHSFTPLAATDGVQVSLERLQGVTGLDGPVATVRAGTTLRRLGAALAERGMAQANLGDIDKQAIAGALATGTHGTGIGHGVLATQLAGLTLVTPAGEVLVTGPSRHPAVFEAARVSLGALGVVAEVRLVVEPAYRLAHRIERRALDEVLAELDGLVAGNRHFEFFWFPHSPHVMAKTGNRTDEPADRGAVQVAYEYVFENLALLGVSQVARLAPALAPAIGKLSGRAVRSVSGVESSAEVFATPRLVRFDEMEYALPLDAAAAVVSALADLVARERFRVHFPVEVRFAAGDDIPLSPAYGRDTCFVAVHQHTALDHRDYFRACEELFVAHGGRPHWGKLHTRTADDLRAAYPRFDDFRRVREDLDPSGLLLTPYLRTLLGV